VGDVAGGGGQPEPLGGPVEVAEQRTAADPGPAPVGVDANRAQRRQVDHQAALRHRDPQDAVAAAANPQLQVVRTAEAHRGGDVGGAGAAGDDRRPPVDHRVPHPPGLVIGILAGQQDPPFEGAAQPRHVPAIGNPGLSFVHPALLATRRAP
jgi:hypothetical protein